MASPPARKVTYLSAEHEFIGSLVTDNFAFLIESCT